MKCRDFERMCDERIDARTAGRPAEERALAVHAAACPACRAVAERYEVLRQAIEALGPPPTPPADFAARCLAAWDRMAPAPAPRTLRFRPAVRWAAAAALLLLAGAGVRSRFLWKDPTAVPIVRQAPPAPARPLASALADATAATLDLAWETSAPAARVGREVLGDVAVPVASAALPLPLPLPVSVESAMEAWSAGVRPFSGSARQAFGFLLGPALGVKDAPPAAETGA